MPREGVSASQGNWAIKTPDKLLPFLQLFHFLEPTFSRNCSSIGPVRVPFGDQHIVSYQGHA